MRCLWVREGLILINGHQQIANGRFKGAGWFVAIWLGLAAVFLLTHFSFYFRESHLELGDLAADALQIHDAKYFRDLWGQYSRWGFHHTGPGFFYTYAAGKWIIFDLFRLVPLPVQRARDYWNSPSNRVLHLDSTDHHQTHPSPPAASLSSRRGRPAFRGRKLQLSRQRFLQHLGGPCTWHPSALPDGRMCSDRVRRCRSGVAR